MVNLVKNETANIGFITFATLASMNLWSFQLLSKQVYSALDIVALAGFVLVVLFLYRKIKWTNLNFRFNIYLFLFVPILSAFGAYLYHDQALGLSLFIIRANFYWLMYFVLHIFNIPKKQIVNLLLFVGGVWIFLTIAQQFTYPHFYFYTRGASDDESFYRAGVYRFMLNRQQYGLFVIFYCFHQYLTRQKLRYLIFVLIGLAGMYYYGARQFLAAAMVCTAVAVLFARGKAQLNTLGLALCAGVALLFLKDVLFTDYVQMTTAQIENSDDDIRVLSANFYLYEYWPSWVCKIIGNGVDSFDSSYGQEMHTLQRYLHFFRSDVGIIGNYNQFGIFYVINVLWANLKGLSGKFYDKHNRYLRLFFINTLMLLVLSEYFADPASIPFYCLIFYLVDKTYEEKKAGAEGVA